MAKESFETVLGQFCRSKRLIFKELARQVVGQTKVIEQMFAAEDIRIVEEVRRP